MKPLHIQDLAPVSGSGYPEPFRSRMGQAEWRALGDAFGLTQFGVNEECLQPGAQSALRHWHTLADELVIILEGVATLITNAGESRMTTGMCMGFKAGDRNAHHLINRSDKPLRFLVVGTRVPGDSAFYPDDDMAWFASEDQRVAVHKDGSPYPKT